jgi:hypothetical protein
MDYMVVGPDGDSAEVDATTSELAKYRALKAAGLPPDSDVEGAFGTQHVHPVGFKSLIGQWAEKGPVIVTQGELERSPEVVELVVRTALPAVLRLSESSVDELRVLEPDNHEDPRSQSDG